jgi:hypothetical protein
MWFAAVIGRLHFEQTAMIRPDATPASRAFCNPVSLGAVMVVLG